MHYQAHPPLVRGQVLRPMSVTEFAEACEILLAEPQPYGYPYWLLDGRADSSNHPADVYEWLVEDFLPRVHRALDRVPCLTFVARPEFWAAQPAATFRPG